jgi:hypothetical protein
MYGATHLSHPIHALNSCQQKSPYFRNHSVGEFLREDVNISILVFNADQEIAERGGIQNMHAIPLRQRFEQFQRLFASPPDQSGPGWRLNAHSIIFEIQGVRTNLLQLIEPLPRSPAVAVCEGQFDMNRGEGGVFRDMEPPAAIYYLWLLSSQKRKATNSITMSSKAHASMVAFLQSTSEARWRG